MLDSTEVLFDRVGLCYIERYWWSEDAARALKKVLGHFLSPSQGRAWFRTHDGEWAMADEEHWETTQALLLETASVWMEESEEDQARIARRIFFRHKKHTRILLLSATPFKAFTGYDDVGRGERLGVIDRGSRLLVVAAVFGVLGAQPGQETIVRVGRAGRNHFLHPLGRHNLEVA